jgi:anti-sigma factor RsiW
MSSCFRDEQLKAFVDGEFPEPRGQELTRHIASCGDCSLRLQFIRSLTADVGAELGELGTADADAVATRGVLRVAPTPAGTLWRWMVPVAGAIAMSGLVTALAGLRFHRTASSPNRVQAVTRAAPSISPAEPFAVQPANVVPAAGKPAGKPPRRNGAKPVMTFVTLDADEPMEIGTLVRIKFPAAMFSNVNPAKTPQVEADAIVDEHGRVRAIRVLDSNLSAKEQQ